LSQKNLDRMGDMLIEQGKYPEAEECYLHVQAIYSSLSDAHGEVTELKSLGVLYVRQGRHTEAEECFAQARLQCACIVDEEGEAAALDGLQPFSEHLAIPTFYASKWRIAFGSFLARFSPNLLPTK
ncbi:hypothetical protein FS837_003940, partial [Tulasnella sp. UAMH 9824]